jgi:hypothetical protein
MSCETQRLFRANLIGFASLNPSYALVLTYSDGPLILIENKIDAAYSVTREGHGQPQRYQKTVAEYRAQGVEAYSVLLAPDAPPESKIKPGRAY